MGEGFESYANDFTTGARTITLSGFSLSYATGNAGDSFGVTDVLNPTPGSSGLGPTAGSKYLYADFSAGANNAVGFNFVSPILAFGIDIKDLEVANINYLTSSGDAGTAGVPGIDGNVQFFGIVSDTPFTSVSFTEPGLAQGDGLAFDQTTFSLAAAAVPEPATLGLFMAGLLFLRGARRSRV